MATTARQTAASRRPVKTALHQAVLDQRLHQVRLLVKQHFGDVDCQDVYGRSPLMLACLLDSEDDGLRMMRIFLEAGAYVAIRDKLGRTALHYACMRGKLRTARRLLLCESVEVGAPDNDGNTPLIHAALSGNPHVVNLVIDVMLKFGVSHDHRNSLGYTALLLACKYSHFVSAHALLTRCQASPTIRDNEFFLDAMDWVKASSDIQLTYRPVRKSHSAVTLTGFSRENTMYSQSSAPVCHHFSHPTHPMGQSLHSTLRLPAVCQLSAQTDLEREVKGLEAQGLLLRELQEQLDSPRYRSPQPVRARRSVLPGILRAARPHPPTAKLLALSPGRNMYPDMRSLLDMYSEQYADRALTLRLPMSAPLGGKSFGTERVRFAEPQAARK